MSFPSPFTRPSDLPNGRFYFIGTPETFNSPDYQNRSIFHVWASPPYFNIALFRTRQEMYAYCQLTNKIKSEIARVTTARDDGRMSDRNRNSFLRTKWIGLIEELVERWGIHRVPHDIRRACNDVRQHLDLALIIFPEEVLYYNDSN